MKRRAKSAGARAKLALLMIVSAVMGSDHAGAAEKPSDTGTKPANTKLYGQINAFGAACLSSGVVPLSTQLPTSIENIKPGSPAYYAGVLKGDKILSASLETNRLNLKIERNNQIFLVRLRARTDNTAKPTLQSQTARFNIWEKLGGYNIAFIIDHSGSMSHPLGNANTLRWDWTKEQFGQFCRQAEANCNANFDLCLFNESYEIERHISAAKFNQRLNETVTTGSTILAPALRAMLEQISQSASAKPLLLFVITDGQAISANENLAILCDYAGRFGNGQRIKLVCIQTGYSEEGAQFTAKLAADCKKRGFTEFMHTIFYEEVSQKGVAPAIAPLLLNAR